VAEARARLAASDHGTFCTVHPERGIDAVPAVFALHDDGDLLVGIPVDRVKPKSSTRLQREGNLESDPRATLLVEQWDAGDWSRLWWVRAELEWVSDPSGEQVAALSAALAARYEQYRDEPFERVLVLRVVGLYGWSAS